MQDSTVFWFLLALFFLFAELSNPGLFYFLAFSFGALASMASTWSAFSFTQQTFLFFGTAFVALFILKFWVQKVVRHVRATNASALIGKQGFVIKSITEAEPGLVKIGGETWSAKALHDVQIPAGIQVEVIKMTGSYLIVVIV